jgi:hypothetical protein
MTIMHFTGEQHLSLDLPLDLGKHFIRKSDDTVWRVDAVVAEEIENGNSIQHIILVRAASDVAERVKNSIRPKEESHLAEGEEVHGI